MKCPHICEQDGSKGSECMNGCMGDGRMHGGREGLLSMQAWVQGQHSASAVLASPLSSQSTWACPGLRLLRVLWPHKSTTPRRPARAVCPLDPPGWMPLPSQLLSLPSVLRQASGTIDPGSSKTNRQGNKCPPAAAQPHFPYGSEMLAWTSISGNKSHGWAARTLSA